MKVKAGLLDFDMSDEGDDRVIARFRVGNSFEKFSLIWWTEFVASREGSVVVDCGAYTGIYSIAAVLSGAGKVIAVEPHSPVAARLRLNLKANRVERKVEVVQKAASNRNGSASLSTNIRNQLTSGSSLIPQKMHNAARTVEAFRLDDLGLLNVSAVKIDVERHELEVLDGAMETIRRDRPHLLIETLEPEMREAALRILPSYRVDAVFDTRNTLFSPK